ncbi:MAG: PKD domain-containing protein [Flavobacteriales bacterium]|nr:PKD domain-containing protein [Flavobacteriales bacterium]
MANTVNNSTTANACLVTRTWSASQLTQGCAPQPGTIGFNAQAVAPQFTFTGQGTYQVTLTLENSCGVYDQTIQPITVNGPPLIDQAPLATICAGGGCVNPSATTQPCGSPITSYGWTFPGGVPLSSTLQVPGQVCYTLAGSYTLTASATNASGTASDPVTLTVSTIPVANAGPDMMVCAGTAATLSGSASGGGGNYTYSWSPITGLSNPAIAAPTVTIATTTTFTLTVTDGGGCIGTDQVTLTVTPPATANAGGPYVTCGNLPVSITAIASGPGQWSAPAGTGTFANATSSTTTFTPAAAPPPTITLTWTTNDPDGAGPCTSVSSTATITVNPPATATVNGPYTGCSKAPVNIATTTNTPGTWTTTGSGSFTNASTASTSYQPGPTDGGTTFTLTWTTTDRTVPVHANRPRLPRTSPLTKLPRPMPEGPTPPVTWHP